MFDARRAAFHYVFYFFKVIMLVSPRVDCSSAPRAAPIFTASCGPWPLRRAYMTPLQNPVDLRPPGPQSPALRSVWIRSSPWQ